MDLDQISYSSLILITTISLVICHPHPHSHSVSSECCYLEVGSQCFCEIEQDTEDYWGYFQEPDYDYLYYGDCECNEISQLSLVLITPDYAESHSNIAIFDTNDEDNVHCLFSHIHHGDEITCNAKGDDKVFADSTSFIIQHSDRSICQGRIDTTCAGDIIINEMDDRCQELVVTGFIGDEGGVCDDGLAPCVCIDRYRRIFKPIIIDSVGDRDDGDDRDDRDNDDDNDEDSDKLDDIQDNDDGDGVIVSPLFAQFLDNLEYTDYFGSGSQSDSNSDSNSNSNSNSRSSSKSGSNSGSKSGSSKSSSDSKSYSHSKSDSNSDSGKSSDRESSANDGRLRILEPVFVNNRDGRSFENDDNEDDDQRPDRANDVIDDDSLFIDSDDSNDGLFIENESNESNERDHAKALAPPLNIPPIHIIEQNMTKTSIYVTMSYYIILLIVLINTLTFGFYFCVRPLQKYCKETMDHNGYYMKPSSKSSSGDIIIQSSIDSIGADNVIDDDISSLSDRTEEE